MSPELERVLRCGGWQPGRRVPTSNWIHSLKKRGFNVLPEAEAILSEYGGLRFEPVESPSDTHLPGVINFDPLAEADIDWVRDWEERLNTRLTPLSQFSGEACLLISEAGKVYTSWDRFLW